MEEYQEIVIEWSEKISLPKDNEHPLFAEMANANVLYQVYGDSKRGKDELLFIGKSLKNGDELKSKLKSFSPEINLKISLGNIQDEDLDLEIPATILIANHEPKLNDLSSNILSPQVLEHKIILINNGNRYSLNACCTNYWWYNSTRLNQLRAKLKEIQKLKNEVIKNGEYERGAMIRDQEREVIEEINNITNFEPDKK